MLESDVRYWWCCTCRIQQIQLLGRGMKGPEHDKLWNQLEAEIHLHRHKTVVRACRGRVSHHCQLPAPQGHVSEKCWFSWDTNRTVVLTANFRVRHLPMEWIFYWSDDATVSMQLTVSMQCTEDSITWGARCLCLLLVCFGVNVFMLIGCIGCL